MAGRRSLPINRRSTSQRGNDFWILRAQSRSSFKPPPLCWKVILHPWTTKERNGFELTGITTVVQAHRGVTDRYAADPNCKGLGCSRTSPVGPAVRLFTIWPSQACESVLEGSGVIWVLVEAIIISRAVDLVPIEAQVSALLCAYFTAIFREELTIVQGDL